MRVNRIETFMNNNGTLLMHQHGNKSSKKDMVKNMDFKEVLDSKLQEVQHIDIPTFSHPKKLNILIGKDGISRVVSAVPPNAKLINTSVQCNVYTY